MRSCTVRIWSIATLLFVAMGFTVSNYNLCAYAHEAKAAPQGRLAFASKVRVSFYPVEGKTRDELTSSMFERGPIGHGNKRFFAYTYWHLKLNHRASKLILKCKVSVLLPFLWPNANRPQKINEDWNSFYKSMLAHESIHVQMAMQTCRQLKRSKATEAMLTATSLRLKKRDQAFDLRTKHGILEGVKLK